MADVTRKLSERVATEILEMITLQKRFSPGDKIPTENELCAELGVSRTTVREAIQKLTAQNILEVHRGKGTYVTDSTQALSSDIFSTLSYMGIRLKDLYEIRLIFEPQAAYYAAQRATDEELAQILEYGQILREKLLAGEDCVEINRLFHNSIALSTHNEFMVRLVPIINSEIVRLFSETNIKQVVHRHTLSDHDMILNYMEFREAQGARVAMELHILHSMQDYDF